MVILRSKPFNKKTFGHNTYGPINKLIIKIKSNKKYNCCGDKGSEPLRGDISKNIYILSPCRAGHKLVNMIVPKKNHTDTYIKKQTKKLIEAHKQGRIRRACKLDKMMKKISESNLSEECIKLKMDQLFKKANITNKKHEDIKNDKIKNLTKKNQYSASLRDGKA